MFSNTSDVATRSDLASPAPGVTRVLAILPGYMPSTWICVIRPLLGLQAKGLIQFRVALELYMTARQLQGVDLVVFCRNVEPRYRYLLDSVLERGIPYIFDLDDNLFAVPPDIEDGRYYSAPERTGQLSRYLRSANLVRVYSPGLFDLVRAFNPAVVQVDAAVDWALIRPAPARRESDRVKVVYATSRSDDYLFSIFTPALEQVLIDYPRQVEMHFWGFQPSGFENRLVRATSGEAGIFHKKYNPDYNQFMRQFSSAGFDIGLAPMPVAAGDHFHRAKTNNKFREYGACGMAGIYSNAPAYADCVEDGKTGLLVENTSQAWYAALVTLIQDAGLRCRLGGAARLYVQQHYSPDRFQAQWLQHIQQVVNSSRLGVVRPLLVEDASSHVDIQGAGEPADAGVAAQVSAPQPLPAGLDAPRSAWQLWLGKFRRGVLLLKGRGLAGLLADGALHLRNFWWTIKINRFKSS